MALPIQVSLETGLLKIHFSFLSKSPGSRLCFSFLSLAGPFRVVSVLIVSWKGFVFSPPPPPISTAPSRGLNEIEASKPHDVSESEPQND